GWASPCGRVVTGSPQQLPGAGNGRAYRRLPRRRWATRPRPELEPLRKLQQWPWPQDRRTWLRARRSWLQARGSRLQARLGGLQRVQLRLGKPAASELRPDGRQRWPEGNEMPCAGVEPKAPVDLRTGRVAKGYPLVVVHHRVKDAAAPHRPHLLGLTRAELTIRAGRPVTGGRLRGPNQGIPGTRGASGASPVPVSAPARPQPRCPHHSGVEPSTGDLRAARGCSARAAGPRREWQTPPVDRWAASPPAPHPSGGGRTAARPARRPPRGWRGRRTAPSCTLDRHPSRRSPTAAPGAAVQAPPLPELRA